MGCRRIGATSRLDGMTMQKPIDQQAIGRPGRTRAALSFVFVMVVLDVMARMRPRLVVGDCHFSHKEASVDPHDVAQLWNISDRSLDLMERAGLAFAASHSLWQFVGHYHRWWAATPEGPLGWSGSRPLQFEPGHRYFVVVAAVCDGWCGILDTERAQLEPLWCGAGESGAASSPCGPGR